MSTNLTVQQIDQLAPLMGSISRLVARDSIPKREHLVKLLGDDEPLLIDELARWVTLLVGVRQDPSEIERDITVEALMLRGLPEATVFLAVSTVTQGAAVSQPPALLRVSPERIAWPTTIAPGERVTTTLEIQGGPGYIQVDCDDVTVTPQRFGAGTTTVQVQVAPRVACTIVTNVGVITAQTRIDVPVIVTCEEKPRRFSSPPAISTEIPAPPRPPAPPVRARTNSLFPVTVPEWEDELTKRNTQFGRPAGYWCYVRPGTYKIGDGTRTVSVVTIDLPAFWIAKHPITVQQYRQFIEDDGYKNKAYWTPNGWSWQTRYDSGKGRHTPYYWQGANESNEHNQHPNQPVVTVTWYEATAFAAWLTAQLANALPRGYRVRLPTEAQWEAAAYDANGKRRTYPWGEDKPTPEHAVYEDKKRKIVPDRAALVGERPKGAAACGAHDMAGNVWEAACSRYAGYPAKAADVVADFTTGSADVPWRGASWYNGLNQNNCMVRRKVYPFNFINPGLRVVVSP